MTIQIDQKTKDRTGKAIANIRLIASRVKRANIQDAMQRCEFVVQSLDNFRKYVNASFYNPEIAGKDTTFKLDAQTLNDTIEAAQQADIIYNRLTREKRASYREEIKQVKLLFADISEYLVSQIPQGE